MTPQRDPITTGRGAGPVVAGSVRRALRPGVVDAVLVLLLGVATSLTHIGWYRAFETSAVVDATGSVAVGVVVAVGHLLVGRRGALADPRSVAVAFAAGVLLHASQAPAFTPFGLGPTGVNRVLFVGGATVGLWSLRRGRSRSDHDERDGLG